MQLTDRVHLVGSGSNGFSMSHDSDCHVYLVDGGSELALIDGGAGLGVPEILQNVRSSGFNLDKIHYLLLTHTHADHAGGSASMRSQMEGLRVFASRDSARFLADGDEKAISLDLGKKGGYYAPEYRFEPCPVDVELVEGQLLQVGDLRIRVVDTPGHCVGHLCYVMEDRGLTYLFAGDAVFFGGRILLQNIWDCDLQAHIRSLRKLAELPVDVFLPGHSAFSLRDGKRHLTAATGFLDKALVPPSLF